MPANASHFSDSDEDVLEEPDPEVTTKVSLLCGGHKLAQHGHEEQVASELLSAVIAVKLKKVVLNNSLIKFDKVIFLGDSLTVARVIRKSNRAYSSWAATRVSYIQRNQDTDQMYHVPGSFLVPTVDKATRASKAPSTLMDKAYWEGCGTIDVPLNMLPITSPSRYTTSELAELPANWLHKTAVQLTPNNSRATITCHRIEVETDDSSVMLQQGLQRLKVKYRSFEKIKRIMQYILHLSPSHRSLPPHQLWKVSELKWLRMEHDIVKASLLVSKTPQSLSMRTKIKAYSMPREEMAIVFLCLPTQKSHN